MEKGTLIKVFQTTRKPNESTEYDSLILFYRDQDGIKKTKFISRAEVPYYILNDPKQPEASSPPMFIEKDKVTKYNVYSDMLYREIALKTNSLPYYDRIMVTQGRHSRAMRNLFKHNLVYNSDMDIPDRYIKEFNDSHEPDISYKLKKCYYDIEVDLMHNGFVKDAQGRIGYVGFPDEDIAPCPINIITLIDDMTMSIHTFVVRNKKNASQIEFEKNVEDFKVYIKDKIMKEDQCAINNVYINFYDDELDAISAFFDKAHEINPDFMLAWNSHFDLQTMYNRLVKLNSCKSDIKANGIRPRDEAVRIMCDKNYFYQKDSVGNDVYLSPKYYYYAQTNKQFSDRADSITLLDGINWMDQMIIYANVRKSQGQKESYALDAIANEELGKEKLPFHPGQTIKNLPWLNFWQFAEYNIRDVLLLHLLEMKNLDMETVQKLSDITNTRKEKIFKKTISLKNFVTKFAEDSGFVIGNNKNSTYGDDEGYFEANYIPKKDIIESDPKYKEAFTKRENFGAYVGDPNMNEAEGIDGITNKSSKFIFENVFDEDLSALYPSIIRSFNLDKNTQLGKFFLLDEKIKDKLVDKYGYDELFATSKNEEADKGALSTTSDIGTTFVDSVMSRNWTRIGEKYFDLPSTEDLISEIDSLIK